MVNIGKLALGIFREKYTAGTRVELVHMSDPYNTALVPGARGTVVSVDDRVLQVELPYRLQVEEEVPLYYEKSLFHNALDNCI